MSLLAILGMFLTAIGLILTMTATASASMSLAIGAVTITILGIVSMFLGSELHEHRSN